MQLNLKYEEKEGYLLVIASGAFTAANARGVFAEWVEKAKSLGLHRVLTDVTQVTGLNADEARVMTRFEMAVFVADSLPSNFRLAVLIAPSQMLEDRFDENFMVNRGANVKMATSEDEAVAWLTGTSIDTPSKDPSE